MVSSAIKKSENKDKNRKASQDSWFPWMIVTSALKKSQNSVKDTKASTNAGTPYKEITFPKPQSPIKLPKVDLGIDLRQKLFSPDSNDKKRN